MVCQELDLALNLQSSVTLCQEFPVHGGNVGCDKYHRSVKQVLQECRKVFSFANAPVLHPRDLGTSGCSFVCGAVRSALSGPSRKRKADPLESLKPALP